METKEFSKQAVLRFVIGSLLGILFFFIKVPINGANVLIVDWAGGVLKGLLANYHIPLALVCSVSVLYRMIKTKFWKNSILEIIIDSLSILAMVLFVLDALNLLPAFIVEDGTWNSAVGTMIPFSIGIATIMFFLAPLISYGLPEAVGVFAQPLTRPLFRLPGVSAVTVVSAFMGNFTVGHLQTDEMYTSGKLTHKEAAIMATGFCTSSVGLIMSVCAAAGLTERFTMIFFMIFIATLVITAITAHIYPLCRYPETYYEGTKGQTEQETEKEKNVLRRAYEAGVGQCVNSKAIPEACVRFGIHAMPSVANIAVSGVACNFVFSLINKYTPIFNLIGKIFYPLYKLVGFQDVNLVASAMGINAVDNTVSQVMLATSGSDPMTVFFGCGCGIMTIVFFGAFIASLYSTKIKVKFQDLLLIWAERTALTIVIWGFVARFFA